MKNDLQVFKNNLFEVAVKLENGEVLFEAEKVAKCLGFIEVKNNKEYVRWRTVNDYLKFSQDVAKGDFIPEPAVYKLAFKASNEVAEKFQEWLAVDVLPSIRKHGTYMTESVIEKALTSPEFLIKLATNLKEEKSKRIEAEKTNKLNKPKVVFAEALEISKNTILVGELAKLLKQNGISIGQNRLFKKLRQEGYLGSKGEYYNLPTQKAMNLKLFEIKTRTINNPDGSVRVTRTTKVTGKGQIYFINKFKNIMCKVPGENSNSEKLIQA